MIAIYFFCLMLGIILTSVSIYWILGIIKREFDFGETILFMMMWMIVGTPLLLILEYSDYIATFK